MNINQVDAVELAKFTKGYAYAYQVLGEICFRLEKYIIDEEIDAEFDDTIGPQYDLLWDNMTEAEQELLALVENYNKVSLSV